MLRLTRRGAAFDRVRRIGVQMHSHSIRRLHKSISGPEESIDGGNSSATNSADDQSQSQSHSKPSSYRSDFNSRIPPYGISGAELRDWYTQAKMLELSDASFRVESSITALRTETQREFGIVKANAARQDSTLNHLLRLNYAYLAILLSICGLALREAYLGQLSSVRAQKKIG